MSVDGGTPISPSSSYIFSTTGEHTVVWDLIEPVIPIGGFMYSGSSALPILHVEIGDGVVEIGESAFFRTTMTGITIPDTVTKIGDWAFASNQSLGSITLPSGLTTIGTNAFDNCGAMNQLTIPESVTSIGSGAFSQTNIRDINIPSGITSLHTTFIWCPSLTGITFTQRQYLHPYIDLYGTFRHCDALVSYTTPADIEIGGDGTFADCNSLTSLTITNAPQIENGVVSGCSALTSLVLPEETQTVKGYIIKGCSNLTSVTLPNAAYYSQTVINGAGSLKTVQFGKAFLPSSSYTHNLDFVDFLDSVTEQIFQGCTSLTRIDVVVDGELMINQSTTIPSGSFSSDLPANGTIYYYYKSASETDINSQAIANALVSAIGKGWTAVSGGIWNGAPAE